MVNVNYNNTVLMFTRWLQGYLKAQIKRTHPKSLWDFTLALLVLHWYLEACNLISDSSSSKSAVIQANLSF